MARVLLLLLVILSVADLVPATFWGTLKMDCGVSVWSVWGPTMNGRRTRTRQIFRYPQMGGAPCPSLSETDEDPWVNRSVTVKAAKIKGSFLNGGVGLTGKRRRRQTTIKPRDILFVIDMSGSISVSEYESAKSDVTDLISKICGNIGLGQQNNRVAVITFSNRTVENFDFDDYSNLGDVQRAVLGLPRDADFTCTGPALNYSQQMFTSRKGARPDHSSVKEVVLLTDGRTNCGGDPAYPAWLLKNLGTPRISIFVFAISDFDQKGKQEMDNIASSPISNHLFHFPNFREFTKTVERIVSFPKDCAPIIIR